MTTSYVAVLLYAQFGLFGVLGMVSGVLILLVVAVISLGVDANQYSLEAASPDEDALDTHLDFKQGGIAR
jgi:putative MFS transporter